jgi:peptidoglycan/xylan/chitin deacetylase (PgdA/CDA1 family)
MQTCEGIPALGRRYREPGRGVIATSAPSVDPSALGARLGLADPAMDIRPPRSVLDRARSLVACTVPVKPRRLKNTGPIVTFCFDDFPRTAGRAGADIVERHGGHATYFVCAGLLGTSDADGEYADADDLIELVARGHEIACHSFSHLDGLRVGRRHLLEDLHRNAAAIADIIEGHRLLNFAYPFGRVSLGAKLATARRFATARGIEPGINQGTADLAQLRCNLLYPPKSNFETARRLIGSNARRRGWLIFLTHDVRNEPTPYGCTAGELEAIVNAAVASGAQILSIAEALPRVGVEELGGAVPPSSVPRD